MYSLLLLPPSDALLTDTFHWRSRFVFGYCARRDNCLLFCSFSPLSLLLPFFSAELSCRIIRLKGTVWGGARYCSTANFVKRRHELNRERRGGRANAAAAILEENFHKNFFSVLTRRNDKIILEYVERQSLKLGRGAEAVFILLAETYVCETKAPLLCKLWLGKMSKMI